MSTVTYTTCCIGAKQILRSKNKFEDTKGIFRRRKSKDKKNTIIERQQNKTKIQIMAN